MKRKIFGVFALTIVCVLGIAHGLNGDHDPQSKMEASYSVLQIMQSENTNDTERILLLRGWNQFVENLNYSSSILDEFIGKNISDREAMNLAASLFTLNSRTLSAFESIEPSEDRKNFYNYTTNAIKSFDNYLFHMGKFFETNDGWYLLTARNDFNTTQEYYLKGKEESEFIF